MTAQPLEEAAAPPQRRSRMLLGAFVAAIVANLIHNNFGLDLAVAPAALFLGLYWFWRPGRMFLLLTAFFIAFPAFSFLKLEALGSPSDLKWFANHWALFLAGALAVLAVVLSFLPRHSP